MPEVPYPKTLDVADGGIKPGSFYERSTLAMGVAPRLAYVGVAIAVLWLCVWWALQ